MTSNGKPKRPSANVGDIVRITGQGDKRFRIESVNYEHYRDAEVEYSEVFYEATDVNTFEVLLPSDEDIAIVSGWGNSREYHADYAPSPSIDTLLFDLSDALALREIFGDHEDDERRDRKYALKVCEIKAKLRDKLGE